VAFRGRENLQIHVQPTAITHTNDIVIHFRTAKDDGVIFTTWNGHNNDYMKAYLESGHVHLETFIARSSGEVRRAYCRLCVSSALLNDWLRSIKEFMRPKLQILDATTNAEYVANLVNVSIWL